MALELVLITYAYMELNRDRNDLSIEERRRRDKRFPRISLKRYSQSPFLYLFQCGDDQALLNCCAVDHKAFRDLLAIFKPVYDRHTVDKKTGKIVDRQFTRRTITPMTDK